MKIHQKFPHCHRLWSRLGWQRMTTKHVQLWKSGLISTSKSLQPRVRYPSRHECRTPVSKRRFVLNRIFSSYVHLTAQNLFNFFLLCYVCCVHSGCCWFRSQTCRTRYMSHALLHFIASSLFFNVFFSFFRAVTPATSLDLFLGDAEDSVQSGCWKNRRFIAIEKNCREGYQRFFSVPKEVLLGSISTACASSSDCTSRIESWETKINHFYWQFFFKSAISVNKKAQEAEYVHCNKLIF